MANTGYVFGSRDCFLSYVVSYFTLVYWLVVVVISPSFPFSPSLPLTNGAREGKKGGWDGRKGRGKTWGRMLSPFPSGFCAPIQ